jgi:hypothetical protein
MTSTVLSRRTRAIAPGPGSKTPFASVPVSLPKADARARSVSMSWPHEEACGADDEAGEAAAAPAPAPPPARAEDEEEEVNDDAAAPADVGGSRSIASRAGSAGAPAPPSIGVSCAGLADVVSVRGVGATALVSTSTRARFWTVVESSPGES